MRPHSHSRRAFLAGVGGLGALAVTGSARGVATQDDCSPGHTEGDPACQQIEDDTAALVRFDALDTDLLTSFAYPCGWNTSTTTYEDRIQANATRSDIGEVGAYVDIQVRNYHDPVEEGFLDQTAEEGDYDEMDYEYAGETRTGLVSSPDTAYLGTIAHAVVPDHESDDLRHVEVVSTMTGADCEYPRPDYDLVREMLASIEPNREHASVTFEDQSVSGEVDTQSVVVASVDLPSGGFVAIHTTPLQETDLPASVVGASSYLSGGTTHQNVRIALDSTISSDTDLIAMAHRDTDDDNIYDFGDPNFPGDGPYETGGDPVTDRAAISVVSDTPVPTESWTETPTLEPLETETPTGELGAPPTASPSPSPTPSQTAGGTDETEEDGAGFGVVGAMGALVSAAAVRRWWRDRVG